MAQRTVRLMQHKAPQSIDRPAQRPALRRGIPIVWRDATTLQIGIAAPLILAHDSCAEALVTARFLNDLDGTRAWSEILEHDSLLHSLCEHGFISDAAQPAIPSTEYSRERMQAELAALGLNGSAPTQPHDILHARAQTTVSVRGDGRVGTAIATLLAASGIGRILLSPETGGNGRSLVSDYDTGSHLRTSDIGTNRIAAVRAAIDRAALAVGPRSETSLTIIARDCVSEEPWIDPESALDLVSAQRPHLFAAVAGTKGRIGPFVIDGTPCQRCYALHRTDADEGWPMMAAHLIRPRRTVVPPVAAIAVAQIAAMTVITALNFLDHGDVPDGVIDLQGWDISTTELSHHQRCGCSCRISDLRAA